MYMNAIDTTSAEGNRGGSVAETSNAASRYARLRVCGGDDRGRAVMTASLAQLSGSALLVLSRSDDRVASPVRVSRDTIMKRAAVGLAHASTSAHAQMAEGGAVRAFAAQAFPADHLAVRRSDRRPRIAFARAKLCSSAACARTAKVDLQVVNVCAEELVVLGQLVGVGLDFGDADEEAAEAIAEVETVLNHLLLLDGVGDGDVGVGGLGGGGSWRAPRALYVVVGGHGGWRTEDSGRWNQQVKWSRRTVEAQDAVRVAAVGGSGVPSPALPAQHARRPGGQAARRAHSIRARRGIM